MRIKLNQMEIIIAVESYVRSKITGDRQVQIEVREERLGLLELAHEELLELRGFLVGRNGKFEPDFEKLEKYWNGAKPKWEKDLQDLQDLIQSEQL